MTNVKKSEIYPVFGCEICFVAIYAIHCVSSSKPSPKKTYDKSDFEKSPEQQKRRQTYVKHFMILCLSHVIRLTITYFTADSSGL